MGTTTGTRVLCTQYLLRVAIEAGGRDSVVIGRKERAKRRETGEDKLIGRRAKREKVWGGDTRVHDAAGRREGRDEGPR